MCAVESRIAGGGGGVSSNRVPKPSTPSLVSIVTTYTYKEYIVSESLYRTNYCNSVLSLLSNVGRKYLSHNYAASSVTPEVKFHSTQKPKR